MFEKSKVYLDSEIGTIEIVGTPLGIESISFVEAKEPDSEEVIKPIQQCKEQLQAYFNGELKEFTVPLNFEGTEFQKKVWHELRHIPYGETISYLKHAKNLGDAKAIRAVGTANGKNPVAIIVPCHRVIGADGSLTGYAGGVWRKEWLLNHEAKHAKKERQMELF